MTGDQKGFALTDYTWVKVNKCSWWPAQVVGEKAVSDKCKPKRKALDETLVRLYGTYIHLYVDIWKCRLEFANVLKNNNCCAREEFHRTIEKLTSGIRKCSNIEKDCEDVVSVETNERSDVETKISKLTRKKGKFTKENAESHMENIAEKGNMTEKIVNGSKRKRQKIVKVPKSEEDKKQKKDVNLKDGVSSRCGSNKWKAAKGSKADSVKNKEQDGGRVKKSKEKSLKEEKKVMEKLELNCRTPESTRRVKVMQSLGLIAPCGSPFRNGVITSHG